MIRGFSDSLLAGFKFLDDTVASVLDIVQRDLKELINRHVLSPIQQLLNSFDCSFMRSFWSGLTNSLCLRSVSGFHTMSVSYLVAAILSLSMATVMYIPWRVSRDNYDTSLDVIPPVAAENVGAIEEVSPNHQAAQSQAARAEVEQPLPPGRPDPSTSLSL